jgi:hypothetical protein
MSRATLMHGILVLADSIDDVRASIGARPPWWRPFARRRWGIESTLKRAWIAKAEQWMREAFKEST